MNILITNGHIIDPQNKINTKGDIAIASNRIVGIPKPPANFEAQRTIDASGCYIFPGIIDLNARLREPGHEHAKMLESELAAAAAGGITTLVCTPDTDPVLDEAGLVEMLKKRAQRLHLTRVLPQGALTRGLKGETLTEMQQLTQAGCIAFGQADAPMPDSRTLQRAMQYAATFGHSIWLRPQDTTLGQGVAASGALAMKMGLAGVPDIAETIALHTIFELLSTIPANSQPHIHLCRISSAKGIELIEQAKKSGLNITADVSIQSVHLTDSAISQFNSAARLTPVLRQEKDKQAITHALKNKIIDAVVSDHTPAGRDEKTLPFAEATAGASALEILLPKTLEWAEKNSVTIEQAIELITINPAKIIGKSLSTLQVSSGQICQGAMADLCIYDSNHKWEITAQNLKSKGKSTPFAGEQIKGKVKHTIINGAII